MNNIISGLFLTGVLFGSGPCVASCGPFLISYIAGTRKTAARGVVAYILFSSARVSVYIALGVSVFFLSRFAVERLLGGLQKYILISGGVFMIIVGFFMVFSKRMDSGLCRKISRHLLERDKKSIVAAGLVIGLLPCLPLLSVLSYIGLVSRGWADSVLYSLSFGMGTFVSPLIVLVIFSGLIQRLFAGKNDIYRSIFTSLCGLVIIFLGARLISAGL